MRIRLSSLDGRAPRRRRVSAVAVGLLAVLAAGAAGTSVPAAAARDGAAGSDRAVVVYFTRGEQLATAARVVDDATALPATIALLLEGPTAEERTRGLRSSIPAGVALNGVSLRRGVATIDVSRALATGTRQSLQARLAQLVFTATQFRASCACGSPSTAGRCRVPGLARLRPDRRLRRAARVRVRLDGDARRRLLIRPARGSRAGSARGSNVREREMR